MSIIQAEYIWIDGTEPTPLLRSKTKMIAAGMLEKVLGAIAGVAELPKWGFDGSSTNQATGDDSDCQLYPVFAVRDPLRGGDNLLVLCEVYKHDGSPHETNTRRAAAEATEKYKNLDAWYGFEQEYTMMKDGYPLGFPEGGYPGPQGPYYCGVGAQYVFGREVVEEHMVACIKAGLKISGINAEVMPGQWEFQIGPAGVVESGDHMYMARYLLGRIAETYGVDISYDAKPAKGDWNGAGCHTNFSTKAMREDGGLKVIHEYCERLAQPERIALHLKHYGAGLKDRLTGAHETASWQEFKYGVSDRGASIRIPMATDLEGKGYLEDRRPCANIDPYTVARLLVEAAA
ncbi:MAG: glutamine synthetase beta-grasp domain-containing protein [Myxococcales bacterium]|nr:glutamine synthetase beta-grasp domain-containing protein [Myxococcales bacterium]MDH3845480.1 glutamine synthetase beta-grasp domain-containing protein [Myxococcales bacterium]